MVTETLKEVLPKVIEGRAEGEQSRQLATPVVAALRERDFGRLSLGAEYGGVGASLSEMVEVMKVLAYEDAVVSWVVWNANLVGLYARYMSEQLREEIFQQRHLFCQSTIPAGVLDLVNGEVVGQWPLVSGCSSADWAILTCQVKDSPGETRLVGLAREQFEIVDTWHTNGLRGSGSHDVRVSAVSVPQHRTFSLTGEPSQKSSADYLPIFASVSALFGAQLLGLGNAVYDASVQRITSASADGRMPMLWDREEFQIATARHGASLAIAEQGLSSVVKKIDNAASRSEQLTPSGINDLYKVAMVATDTVRCSTEEWARLGGTSALYIDSPLEKRTRDLQAMLRHIVAQPSFQADIGRIALGREPMWPLFLV